MMNGYDKQEAQEYILSKIDRRMHKELESLLNDLVSDAIEFDMAYMHENNVIDQDGNAGTAYYDDDEAFEYVLDRIATKHKMSADLAMKTASFLDDFMDGQQAYMELKGLVDWD